MNPLKCEKIRRKARKPTKKEVFMAAHYGFIK